MQPVNHWQPVTTEYQHELAPIMDVTSLRSRPFGPAYSRFLAAPLIPFGILCITALYFLSACAYFFCASTLFSHPESDIASWLVERYNILVPIQVVSTPGIPLIKPLAETFLLMAIVSLAVAILWLLRPWYIRWITMCFAAAALIRTALILLAGKAAGLTVELTLEQKQFVLLLAAVNLVVFCYLAFYPGVADACERRR